MTTCHISVMNLATWRKKISRELQLWFLCSYKYSSFNQLEEIRLLKIYSGRRKYFLKKNIECFLIHVSLNDISQYNILLYIWNSSALKCHVSCDDNCLWVVKNLRDTLFRLCQFNKNQLLWIDSVCIYFNQITMKYFRIMRFISQFSEKFNFTHLTSQILQYNTFLLICFFFNSVSFLLSLVNSSSWYNYISLL